MGFDPATAKTAEQLRNAELLERANQTWRNQQMSTNAVANKLMDLIADHCSREG
jgi:hypothetical protein